MDTTKKSTCWSVTINNPVDADEHNISEARQKGWKVTGQLERGQEGTLHYQLAVRTPQVRWSAVKKAFPRAHIEVAKNARALQAYVQKQETREGELVEQDAMYPSLSQLWDLIYQFLVDQRIIDPEAMLETNSYDPAYPDTATDAQLALWHSLNQDPLLAFDQIVRHLIERGYHVESMASNPQNRFAFRYYNEALMARSAHQQQNVATRHTHHDEMDETSTQSVQTTEIPTTPETSSP